MIKNLFQGAMTGSFLFLLLPFALVRMVFHSYFHVNDDDWVIFFTKGVGLSLHPDVHVYTNNILLGYLLKGAYALAPSVNWYAYGLTLSVFLSFWAFLAALALTSTSRLKKWLFLTGFVFYGIYFILHLNYTMEGILLAQSGIFLLAACYSGPESAFPGAPWILGFFCLALSFLIRPESFFFAALTAIPFLLPTFWGKWPSFRRLLPLLALGAVLAGCLEWNDHCYQSDPAWNSFVQKISCFHKIYDFRDMEYNAQTEPYFREIGWDRNDADLFKNYFFMDDKKFNIENLEKLGKHLPVASVRGKGGNFTSLWDALVGEPVSLLILVCAIFFSLFARPGRYRWIVLNFLWVVALTLFLMYFARALERVVLPCLASLANLCLFWAEPPDLRKTPRASKGAVSPGVLKLVWALMLAGSLPVLGHDLWENRVSDGCYRSYKRSLVELAPRDDQLFVVWGSDLYHEFMDAFDDFDIYRKFHIFIFGAWSLSPYGGEMLRHFGIQNIVADMVDRPNVFLICRSPRGRMLHQYILDNQHKSVHFQKVFEGFHFNVYRVLGGPVAPEDREIDNWLSAVLEHPSAENPPPPPPHVVSKLLSYGGTMDTMDFYLAAKALVRSGHYKESEAIFKKAGELDPDFIPPPSFLAELERRAAASATPVPGPK